MAKKPSTRITDFEDMAPVKAEAIATLCALASTGDEADRCHVCRAFGGIGR